MLDPRHSSAVSWLGDLAAATSVVGALLGLLPYLAALLGIIWYFVQFWESPLRKRWSARRRLARLARLERARMQVASEIESLRSEITTMGGIAPPAPLKETSTNGQSSHG